jgi:CBS domain-containing protein
MQRSEFEEAYDDDLCQHDEWLSTPISKLMDHQPIVIDTSATAAQAVMTMNVHHTGCVLVQEDDKLVGIFTERDVITKVFQLADSETVSVGSVMTRNPETLEPKDELAFALNRMSVGGYRHIPIVDNGKPVSVLSVRDIVDYLADLHPGAIVNLPPSPDDAIVRSVDGA